MYCSKKADAKHDPAKWFNKAKERFDPQVESDIYDKLPIEGKVQRLRNALSHSDQCMPSLTVRSERS